ncbi:MAG: type III-B CRISPR module RAMP protein Cmr4 [Deltaproteobacteria bacterium]|nr:type III-B CRISPR module RAMP protein Cmr4 [Deltaproteobacteria bacterium]
MTMIVKPYFLKTRSGLHCGIGQGLSDIDMPTAKEAVSGFPFVPGTSLKGVLRDYFDGSGDGAKFEAAFGQAGEVPEFASALSFGDARLLCLPARSYFGVFAHVCSPYTLRILRDNLQQIGRTNLPAIPAFSNPDGVYHASITTQTVLIIPHDGGADATQRVLLEDLDLQIDAQFRNNADQWAETICALLYPDGSDTTEEDRRIFSERFMIVPDDVLAFLCETALPVATRIRIGENGVVETGALWYEEYVPPETLFAGILAAENGRGRHREFIAQDLMEFVAARPIDCQIGGGATVGRGMVNLQFCR